jgi:hypothetical protein
MQYRNGRRTSPLSDSIVTFRMTSFLPLKELIISAYYWKPLQPSMRLDREVTEPESEWLSSECRKTDDATIGLGEDHHHKSKDRPG